MKNQNKKTSSGKRKLLIALCVVLALVFAVMLGGTIYMEYLMSRINYVSNEELPTLSAEELAVIENGEDVEEEAEFTGPVVDENDVTWADSPNLAIGEEDTVVNILLIGQDTRNSSRARSDSMILCTFDTIANKLTLTSFMRDLYVQIPGYSDNRINAAYSIGGMELLNDTLYENFGVYVDGNVEVDFSQFADIIDLLGGVTLELTQSEASYINKYSGSSGVSAGVQVLNGAQALSHARNRYSTDGDFSRTSRQRALVTALIEEYKSKSLTTLLGLLDDILPMVTTDMTKSDITGYVKDLLPLLADVEMATQTIPVEGGYQGASIRGMSVLVPDLEVNRQALMDTLVERGVG